jgi:putative transcriptional regulator
VVTVDKSMFDELLESVQQMDAIARGARKPSRVRVVDASVEVKAIRAKTKLSQAQFARLLNVDVATLRNWEQGRRKPQGPARALLKAVDRDPKAVLSALNGA